MLALAAGFAAPTAAGAVPVGPVPIVTVGLGVPAAPQPEAAPNFSAVRLIWTPADSGAGPILRYSVYRGLSPLMLFPYATVEPSGDAAPVEYVDRSADLGVTYHYAVTATNAVGEGARSETVSASPAPVGTVFATAKWTGRDDAYDIAMLAGGVVTKLSRDDGDHQTPAVSPDGSALVYASNHGNAPGDYDLWVQRPGGEPVRITTGPEADAEPAFSPDGSTIAFTRLTRGMPRVFTVPTAGGEARAVPETNGDGQPAWSPSGRLLAVAHATGMTGGIAVTNLDGTYRRDVRGTVTAAPAYDPSFSPDGTTLSFVLGKETGGVVATVPVEGGHVTEQTGAGLAVAAQQWAPSGDRIVFEGYSESTRGTMWSVVPGTGAVEPVPGGAAEAGLSPTPAEAPAPYVPLSTPVAPIGLTGALGAAGVALRWSPPPGAQPGTWYVVRRSGPDGVAPRSPDAGVAVASGPATAARAGGLSPAHRYAFAVFAVSPQGDAGPAAVRAARPAATPSVLASPSADGPGFVATWDSAQGLAAGQAYEVQVGVRRLDRGAKRWSAPVWRTLSRGAATGVEVAGEPGQTYHLRARVRDADGNATPWGAHGLAVVPYDDRDMSGTGRWTDVEGKKGRYAGTLRTSSSYGSEISLKAWGSSFALLADRCRACGKLEIYVDGELVATVDTYAATQATRQVVWSAEFGRIGRHLVTVRVVGTGDRRTAKIDGLAATR